MVYWNVLVESPTKAVKNKGKLYISSGIIELESGEFSCITAVRASGGTVSEIKEEEKKPEPDVEVKVAPLVQSKPEKKKKK